MTDETRVPIAKAKGRPMLSWVGKRPLREVRSFPAQLVERFVSAAPAGAVSADVDWSGWPDRFDHGHARRRRPGDRGAMTSPASRGVATIMPTDLR